MRYLLTISLFLGFMFSSVHAEYENDYSEPKFGEVEKYDFDFSVEQDGRKVEVEWEAYGEDNFKWYKLLRSSNNSEPVYPDDHVFRVITDQDVDETYDYLPRGVSYYRLCVVTQENDRLCSRVVKIYNDESNDEYSYKSNNTDLDKNKYNRTHLGSDAAGAYNDKSYTKTNISDKKPQKYNKNTDRKVSVSSKIRTRLNNFIETFSERLEKSDLSDEQKAKKIETILNRLEELKEKKPNLSSVIDYLISSLKELHGEYSNELDSIEALFEL